MPAGWPESPVASIPLDTLPEWLQAHPWQQVGHPLAWERELRC